MNALPGYVLIMPLGPSEAASAGCGEAPFLSIIKHGKCQTGATELMLLMLFNDPASNEGIKY
jgi:hypothetical protein